MKLRTVIYSLLLASFCMGCGGHGHMRQLEQLEAQLDTAPDVVRLALDSIPLASLSDEERALYAILRTQADYKCYVLLTTDTLIRYATGYYNRNRKSYRTAMAWCSLGCVYAELEHDAAVDAYLQAQSLFPDTTVRYYRLCYDKLGRHYLNRNMPDEALTVYTLYHNLTEGYFHLYADIGLALGENNYVYLPKMTTTKAVTRSTEIERTYSATINSGLSTYYGPLSVTFTWDSRSASFHLSEGYTTVCPQFVYTINGSTLSVSLTMTVWCDNVRLGDLDYSGTLME